MKKIAFLNLYSGINNRGAESFTHELASRLANDYSVSLYGAGRTELSGVNFISVKTYTHQPSHGLPVNLLLKVCKLLFLDNANLAVLLFTFKISRSLLKEKYDVIFPLNGFWQLLICKIVSAYTGSKIVVTGNSGPGWDEKWNLYLHPDIFIATTGPTAQWARNVAPATKTEVIPYGIDVTKFSRAKAAELALKHPIILCNAAAVEYKQIEFTIRAVSKLTDVSLLHLGSGPLIDDLSKLGKELLGERFLTKSVSYEDIPNYYAACDLVTLASKPQENSPMVFLEAMASGKFVVCPDTERNRWLLEDCAIYLNPANLNDYTKGLALGLKKNIKTEIVKRSQIYSWDKVVKQYKDLLTGLFVTSHL